MVARTLDELLVYRKAVVACAAVSAVLEKPKVRADWDLRVQLAAASGAVPANIAEGFGQQSDRQFVRYLFIARGSAHEVRSHVEVAHGRQHLTDAEAADLHHKYEEVGENAHGADQVPALEQSPTPRLGLNRDTADYRLRLPTAD